MSSATATVMDRRSYWCHESDMSISLLPTSSTASLRPHCNSDFLEELDSSITFDNPNPNNSNDNHDDSNQLLFPSFLDLSLPASEFQFLPETPSDGLDNPYFHHVINHLFNSDYHNTSTVATATTSRLHSQAVKSAIKLIPSVKITTAFLEIDLLVICAICKDQFVIDDETKELLCKHRYHPDCIIPWLSQRNSCPGCRFQLPIDPVEGDSKVRRRSRSRISRLGDLVDEEDDEELLGFG